MTAAEIERVALVTVDRLPAYVHDAISSMRAAGSPPWPIELFVGSPESSYLNRYRYEHDRDRRGIEIRDMPRGMWSSISELPIVDRVTANHARALLGARGTTLLCEDDVIFSRGWHEALERWCSAWCSAHESEPESRPSPAVVTLYSPFLASRSGRLVRCPRPFHGLCALLVPEIHRRDLGEHLLSRVGSGVGADLLTAEFADLRRIDLLATSPSLIDHRGEVSSIGNGGHGPRHAPSFREAVESVSAKTRDGGAGIGKTEKNAKPKPVPPPLSRSSRATDARSSSFVHQPLRDQRRTR